MSEELHDVWVLGFPLDVYERSQEHWDALVRELTLIAQSRADEGPEASVAHRDLPRRLLALVDELSYGYVGLGEEAERVRDAALDRGDRTVDLSYRVPSRLAEACRHLQVLLDDADHYCRQGEHLLTLATPPEARAFRRWYLDEFVRQLAGERPRPWTDHLVAVGNGSGPS